MPGNRVLPNAYRPAEPTVHDVWTAVTHTKAKGIILGLLMGLTGLAFLAGWLVGVYATPGAKLDPIEATKPNNQFQAELRNRPSVKAFEAFLNDAAQKDWQDAYRLLGPSWAKFNVTKPSDLERIYRRTLRQEVSYYIPQNVTDDREEYAAEFAFWDQVPNLPAVDQVNNSTLSAVLPAANIDAMTRELVDELPNDYVVPDQMKTQLPAMIRTFLSRLKLADLVLREDDLVEMAGDEYALSPIVRGNSFFQSAEAGKEKQRFLKVVLLKQNGQWVVDSYDSTMVEKR